MSKHHAIDITDEAPTGARFPLRLRQLEYRLMQVINEQGQPLYSYVKPPLVEIPAGQFLMGSTQQDVEARRGEFPLHLVNLDVYEIALHPLTIFEYLLYLEAVHLLDATSEDLMDRLHTHRSNSPGHPNPAAHLYLDYPVESITWYEATAYANWLAQVTGEQWRLPTEAEWEKAARGLDARLYPWGDEWDKNKANTLDGEPQETTPLGSYPDGRSPYGVYDMVGNVVQWTRNVYRLYPYHEVEWDGSRSKKLAIRGCGAAKHPVHARAASRSRALPSRPLAYQGMRLARGKSGTFLGIER